MNGVETVRGECLGLARKPQKQGTDVVMLSFLLVLEDIHALSWCFFVNFEKVLAQENILIFGFIQDKDYTAQGLK